MFRIRHWHSPQFLIDMAQMLHALITILVWRTAFRVSSGKQNSISIEILQRSRHMMHFPFEMLELEGVEKLEFWW